MDDSSIIAVIQDTLGGREIGRSSPDSCFAWNAAGLRLRAVGQEALPAIEAVIRDQVVPACRNLDDFRSTVSLFPGLASLWLAYFHLCKENHVERAAQFLTSLSGPSVGSGVMAIGTTWRRNGPEGGRVPGVLLEILRSHQRSGTTGNVLAARAALRSADIE